MIGTKQTLTNASAIGASAYGNLGGLSKCAGAIALVVRLWQKYNATQGDRVPAAGGLYVYPVGSDGSTPAIRSWQGTASVAGAAGGAGNFGTVLPNSAQGTPTTPPANAHLHVIPLLTAGVPCPFPYLNLYLSTTTGGANDYAVGDVQAEVWPIYPDGSSPGGLGASNSVF
jgi:hypothetical protein